MEKLRTHIVRPNEPLTDAQLVRQRVFQEEQGIDASLDFDGQDESATHIVIYSDDLPIGTGRLRSINENKVKIERVAVLSEMRGRGIGKLVMTTADDYLASVGASEATLDAQLHAKGFYESLGYVQEGDIFDEVGIEHVVMTKKFT